MFDNQRYILLTTRKVIAVARGVNNFKPWIFAAIVRTEYKDYSISGRNDVFGNSIPTQIILRFANCRITKIYFEGVISATALRFQLERIEM